MPAEKPRRPLARSVPQMTISNTVCMRTKKLPNCILTLP